MMEAFSQKKMVAVAVASVLVVAMALLGVSPSDEPPAEEAVEQKAMLTVTSVVPSNVEWPQAITAIGDIAAWQEASVGSELHGLRLAEVLVDVGDRVHKSQVVARFARETVEAELAQQEAALEEAKAALAEAKANAERGRALVASGALSSQQNNQYLTAERSAEARVMSAQARVQIERIRLRQTEVRAPDDGVISVRNATLGAVPPQGQELFKLIRASRLEWRAQLTANDLLRIKPGHLANVIVANGVQVTGKVRVVAPTIDPGTRNAIVYVDLPAVNDAHAGVFAKGEIVMGQSSALTIPFRSVVMRDGYAYVYQIAADHRVVQTKVTLGRRVADRVEVVEGLAATSSVVDQGAGLLADGDTVNVVGGTEIYQPEVANANIGGTSMATK